MASEGVEQIDTYFAKYLPQLFYSLLAPVTLFALLVGVHARSAVILLCCAAAVRLPAKAAPTSRATARTKMILHTSPSHWNATFAQT